MLGFLAPKATIFPRKTKVKKEDYFHFMLLLRLDSSANAQQIVSIVTNPQNWPTVTNTHLTYPIP